MAVFASQKEVSGFAETKQALDTVRYARVTKIQSVKDSHPLQQASKVHIENAIKLFQKLPESKVVTHTKTLIQNAIRVSTQSKKIPIVGQLWPR